VTFRDPLFTDPSSWKHPDEWKKHYLEDRSPEELRKDVTTAHDRIRLLVRANDELRTQVLQCKSALQKLGWAKIWIKILTFLVAAEGSVIGWLLQAFLSRFPLK